MPLRPVPTFGHPIDDALRRAILDSLEAQTYSTQRVWRTYLSKFGCSQVSELVRRLRDRYGEQAAESFSLELTRRVRHLGWPAAIATPRSALTVPFDGLGEDFRTVLPRLALCALSEAEFLTAIENAMDDSLPGIAYSTRVFVNDRFATLGVPYRYGSVPGTYDPSEPPFHDDVDYEPGTVEFYKLVEPEVEENVIAPALRALADRRLLTAADNYAQGLRRVVKPGGRELRDAVLDFARAVQETLYALAMALGKTPRGGTSGALYGLLKNGPLPEDSEWMVLAASKLRNPTEHPRGRVLDVQHATAEAAMGAASVAITYLASFMPPPPANDVPVSAAAFAPSAADDDIPF
jgi:hypothetical protein